MEPTAKQTEAITTATTETVDPRYADLDLRSTEQIVEVMNKAEMEVPRVIAGKIPQISAAVDTIAAGMAKGGRLIYVGAGTSGRLGVLDASECPPTFSSDPDQVIAIIAGGEPALRRAMEDAEDNFDAGYQAVTELNVAENDTVVGIAASGRTPYVLGAVTAANDRGAATVGVTNNADVPLSDLTQFPIEVVVGPEVLSGSTRLKAGSAQKQVLNILSTASMIRLGKTYGNLMVDVSATNEKLQIRAANLVMHITGCNAEEAAAALDAADGNVKVASVSMLKDMSVEDARALIAANNGSMRASLK